MKVSIVNPAKRPYLNPTTLRRVGPAHPDQTTQHRFNARPLDSSLIHAVETHFFPRSITVGKDVQQSGIILEHIALNLHSRLDLELPQLVQVIPAHALTETATNGTVTIPVPGRAGVIADWLNCHHCA